MRANRVYLLAVVSSLLLYFVGVFTGAAILGFVDSRNSEEFESMRQEIGTFGEDLDSIELELLYLSSGKGELGCRLITTSLDRITQDLGYFWDNLPEKLEVYESENPIDESYESLKKEYMEVSIKAWLLSLSVNDRCGTGSLPVLYFYSRDCEDCIDQGKVLDLLRERQSIQVYTLDLNLDSEAIKVIKEAYMIDETPALVIGEDLYEGYTSLQRLGAILKRGGA